MSDLPLALKAASGPLPPDRIQGSAACLGDIGRQTAAVIERGWLPPDLLTGMTLYLLANQPRSSRSARSSSTERATPIDGSVWVREQATFHRPIAVDDPFVVEGTSLRQYVRKGRRYGVTSSQTFDSEGRRCSTNLTTGLLRYAIEEGDESGSAERSEAPGAHADADADPIPAVDRSVASNNPDVELLRTVVEGDEFVGESTQLTLAMMSERDGENAMNPIHSDAAAAARTGLRAPIAGGSHVLGFAFELVMSQWGPEALMHGALLDVRWRIPVYADTVVTPHATVVSTADDLVAVTFDIAGESGRHLVGSLTIPIA